MSDTPMTNNYDLSFHLLLAEAQKMERELNAANERIKRLEEDLMDSKNQYAVLLADVVLYEDRGERIEQLEKWIAYLHPIAQHSGQFENREWHGVDIRWLYPSQVVYLGEAKP
jgi:hypothetical protein